MNLSSTIQSVRPAAPQLPQVPVASNDFSGTWLATIKPTAGQRTAPRMMIFLCNRDGDVVASRPLSTSQASGGALVTTPGEGSWHILAEGEATMMALLYWQAGNGHPTQRGNLVGVETLRLQVRVDTTGNGWQGTIHSEVRDPSGKSILAVRQGLIEASRIDVMHYQ